MKVKLSDVISGIELSGGGGGRAYLDRDTGEVLGFLNEYFSTAEEHEAGAGLDFHPAWGREMVEDALKVVHNRARYLQLPDMTDFHEYRVMQDFVHGLKDPRRLDSLAEAIQSPGAPRGLRDGSDRAHIEQEWYDYWDGAMRDFARDWCRENGIELEEAEART